MYLIDTSVWIDYLRENNNTAVKNFIEIIEKKLSFGITSIIYQEILQGAASEQDFDQLITYLKTQTFYYPKNEIATYQEAAKIYFNCRAKGITIRSTIDCLIAQIAIENNLILIHNDKDFERIKKIMPELNLFQN